jgi:biopolymer transport protein ExbD
VAVRKAPEVEEPEGFLMTPMIDVTFQLIIFFMLVNNMASTNTERLLLPNADQSFKEEVVDPDLVIVNILDDGRVKINGITMYDPKKNAKDHSRLEKFFAGRRNMQRYWERPGSNLLVTYPMLIRADASTEFMHVQKLMMMATMHGGVYKAQMAAKIMDFYKQ